MGAATMVDGAQEADNHVLTGASISDPPIPLKLPSPKKNADTPVRRREAMYSQIDGPPSYDAVSYPFKHSTMETPDCVKENVQNLSIMF